MSAPTDRGGRAHDPEVIADVREQLERGSLRITGENPANSDDDPAGAPTDLWRYIEWNGVDVKHFGRAQMMIRRGWSVGVPVYLPNADYKWKLPCSKRLCDWSGWVKP